MPHMLQATRRPSYESHELRDARPLRAPTSRHTISPYEILVAQELGVLLPYCWPAFRPIRHAASTLALHARQISARCSRDSVTLHSRFSLRHFDDFMTTYAYRLSIAILAAPRMRAVSRRLAARCADALQRHALPDDAENASIFMPVSRAQSAGWPAAS